MWNTFFKVYRIESRQKRYKLQLTPEIQIYMTAPTAVLSDLTILKFECISNTF